MLDDLRGGLHLVDGDAPVLRELEGQKAPQSVGTGLIVHHGRIFLKPVIIAVLCGLLEGNDGGGVVEVVLLVLAAPKPVEAGAVQRGIHTQIQGIKGLVVAGDHIVIDVLHADAAHPADSVGKVFVYDFLADAHSLEDLGGLVGLEGGNAHLGRDLHDTVENSLVVVVDGCVVVLVQNSPVNELRNALVGQVGIDSPGAVAQDGGKLVHIPRLAALQDDGDSGSLLCPDQVLLHGGDSQESGDGHMVLIHAPVGEDDDVGPLCIGPVAAHKELIQRLLKRGVLEVEQRYHRALKSRPVQGLDLHHVHAGEDGIFHLQHRTVAAFLLQQVSIRSDVHRGVCDDLLPERVDRRVGYLGKELFKIVGERRMLLRQHGQGNIGSHGGCGLRSVCCHGKEHILHILVGVSKDLVELIPPHLIVDRHLLVGNRDVL